ncbi:hypothetical protein CLAFUW4_09529 [Fulvia fulva]|nr:hypothetical protein CLAFUR4_09535 [Fulvia fulva]WPV20769.1 hypothetical protein CLAFUW4_09529 [Fulvia fulva]WPV35714.1 hypothetical protein CLAFUW7_09530 [Fulvia fulva]
MVFDALPQEERDKFDIIPFDEPALAGNEREKMWQPAPCTSEIVESRHDGDEHGDDVDDEEAARIEKANNKALGVAEGDEDDELEEETRAAELGNFYYDKQNWVTNRRGLGDVGTNAATLCATRPAIEVYLPDSFEHNQSGLTQAWSAHWRECMGGGQETDGVSIKT